MYGVAFLCVVAGFCLGLSFAFFLHSNYPAACVSLVLAFICLFGTAVSIQLHYKYHDAKEKEAKHGNVRTIFSFRV